MATHAAKKNTIITTKKGLFRQNSVHKTFFIASETPEHQPRDDFSMIMRHSRVYNVRNRHLLHKESSIHFRIVTQQLH